VSQEGIPVEIRQGAPTLSPVAIRGQETFRHSPHKGILGHENDVLMPGKAYFWHDNP
jgi:hypothetical protein